MPGSITERASKHNIWGCQGEVLTYMRKVDDGDLAAREQGFLLLRRHVRRQLVSFWCTVAHTAIAPISYHSTPTVISN